MNYTTLTCTPKSRIFYLYHALILDVSTINNVYMHWLQAENPLNNYKGVQPVILTTDMEDKMLFCFGFFLMKILFPLTQSCNLSCIGTGSASRSRVQEQFYISMLLKTKGAKINDKINGKLVLQFTQYCFQLTHMGFVF